jgi:hypothetical protein
LIPYRDVRIDLALDQPVQHLARPVSLPLQQTGLTALRRIYAVQANALVLDFNGVAVDHTGRTGYVGKGDGGN